VVCERYSRAVAAPSLSQLGGRTFVGLQVLKPQFKLLYLTLHLLRLATELHAAQLRNRQLQMFDLDYAGTELVLQFGDPLRVCMSRRRMRANQRLQRINVVGQVGIGQIHCDSLRPSAAHGSSGNRRLQSTARAYRLDRLSPVKPFEQERELSGGQRHDARVGARPCKTPRLEALRK
jgi:hypothetical protein